MTQKPVLGVYGLNFHWQNSSEEITQKFSLEEISFELRRGQFLGLFGPNGSGKSTLLKIMSGILSLNRNRHAGQVRVYGEEFLSLAPEIRARKVVYLASDLKADFPITAEEAVGLGLFCQHGFVLSPISTSESGKIRSAMERTFCWDLKDRLLHTLSGGEKQLVLMARAVVQGAKILLLDEALSKMDLHHQIKIGNLLQQLCQKEGYSVILICHDVNLSAELVSDAVFLSQGRIISSGPIREVFTDTLIKKIYPGAKVQVSENPFTRAPKVFFDQG